MSCWQASPSLFDGSLVEAYDRELCLRLKQIRDRVLVGKAAGNGALARPEANIGVVQLLCILHKLDGDARWIEEAVVAYVRTLDWVLRNSADVSWRFQWLSPIRQDPLFDDLFNDKFTTSPEGSTLITTYRAAFGDSSEFGPLYRLVRERVESVHHLVGNPPVVLSKPVEPEISALPDAFPSSPYLTPAVPPWPSKSKKYRERVAGRLL